MSEDLNNTLPGPSEGVENAPVITDLLPADKAWVGQGCVIAQQFKQLLGIAGEWTKSAPEMLHPTTGIQADSLAKSIDRAGLSELAVIAGFVKSIAEQANANDGAIDLAATRLARCVGNVR